MREITCHDDRSASKWKHRDIEFDFFCVLSIHDENLTVVMPIFQNYVFFKNSAGTRDMFI